ncbi:xanthine dehydrogenase family protein subunit M [Actinomadura kijaniata]|uniref:FAD binding domain-containing protein n=1 Tax=Actinomadura kijaniata TaxID=46161 RepID=UPI002FEBE91C
MKPPPFGYHAPRTVGEALDALARGADDPDGGGTKVLAGGQSLIPMLNMRLAAPAALVDINGVTELDGLEATAEGVRVGALARHSRVERSAPAARVQPLLRRALRHVAHPVIRNRGTVVGSLVHADRAAELADALALLGGTVELASAAGRRTVRARDFFRGPLEPALEPGELAVAAFVPARPPGTGVAFAEFARRHGDYALAGVAALAAVDGRGEVASVRAAFLGVAGVPLVLDLTGPATTGRVAAAVRDRLDPEADLHASADYRRHLAGVLAERAVTEATTEAREDR